MPVTHVFAGRQLPGIECFSFKLAGNTLAGTVVSSDHSIGYRIQVA